MAPQHPALCSLGDGWSKLYKPQSQPEFNTIEYPVLRVWGSTPGGQKSLVHLHGALPYLYTRPAAASGINADKRMNKLLLDFETAADLKKWCNHLLKDITCKLEQTIERTEKYFAKLQQDEDPRKEVLREKWERKPLIYSIEVTEKIPMYGFHPSPLPFLKIVFFDPKHSRSLCSVLQSGAINGLELQPYEGHINNILQTFIDFDVSGMGYLHLKDGRFRPPLPSTNKSSECPRSTDPSQSIPQPPSAASFLEFRQWSPETTDAALVFQQPSRSEETASQVVMGFDTADFVLSQVSYGAPTRMRDKHQFNPDIAQPPNYLSRSKSLLELDSTVSHIMNREIRLHEESQGKDSDILPPDKKSAKTFRAVHSLSEIWSEEMDRARRMGMSSQLEAPQLSPNDIHLHENMVNHGLAKEADASMWRRSMQRLTESDMIKGNLENVDLYQRVKHFEKERANEEDFDSADSDIIDRVMLTQAAFDEQARLARAAELYDSEDSDNDFDAKAIADAGVHIDTDFCSTSSIPLRVLTLLTPNDNCSQMPRRDSCFLTQAQQLDVEKLLSQDEDDSLQLESFSNVNHYADLMGSAADENSWRCSQPDRTTEFGVSSNSIAYDNGVTDIDEEDDESVHLGQDDVPDFDEHLTLREMTRNTNQSDNAVRVDNAADILEHSMHGRNTTQAKGCSNAPPLAADTAVYKEVERPGLSFHSLSHSPNMCERSTLDGLCESFAKKFLRPSIEPPNCAHVVESLAQEYGIPRHVAVLPHFSSEVDVPTVALPMHSRRRALAKHRNNLPPFNTVNNRNVFNNKIFQLNTSQVRDVSIKRHTEDIPFARNALPLVIGLLQTRCSRQDFFFGCSSEAVPSSRGLRGWLKPIIQAPSPAAVMLDLGIHGIAANLDANIDELPFTSRRSCLETLDGDGGHDNLGNENDCDEFTNDPNTGLLIPNPYYFQKIKLGITPAEARKQRFPIENKLNVEERKEVKPFKEKLRAESDHLIQQHPLYLTNPERALAAGLVETAALAFESRRRSAERMGLMPPPSAQSPKSLPKSILGPASSPKRARQEHLLDPRSNQHRAESATADADADVELATSPGDRDPETKSTSSPLPLPPASRMPLHFVLAAERHASLRQTSQVSTPTQTPPSSAEDPAAGHATTASARTLLEKPRGGRGLDGGGAAAVRAGAAFQLSGYGATVSSSVGRRVSLLCVEALAATRYQLLPDPARDALGAVAWSLRDTFGRDSETEEHHRASGVLVNMGDHGGGRAGLGGGGATQAWHLAMGAGVEVVECHSEEETFAALEQLFERIDPVTCGGGGGGCEIIT